MGILGFWRSIRGKALASIKLIGDVEAFIRDSISFARDMPRKLREVGEGEADMGEAIIEISATANRLLEEGNELIDRLRRLR